MKKLAIKIENLTYTYPDGTRALDNINLEVYEGESAGIIGRNGAGKSTLILHLNGILNNNSSVRIFDLPVTKKNLKTIRKKVGLVFQNPDDQLFMPTVFDDIAFGIINKEIDKEKVVRKVNEALKFVGMNGYQKKVSHHLSFGEKKRISLATILPLNPKILVFDEPTSNLDPQSRREFIKLIKSFNISKVIASHDLEMILELCDKIILMDRGKIITIGKTKEILKNEKLLLEHGLEMPLSLKQQG